MVRSLSRLSDFSSESRNDEHLSHFEGQHGNAPSQGGEVVLIGLPRLLEDAVFAQSLDHARHLAAGIAGQHSAEVAVTEPVDVEFTTNDAAEQVEVIAMEEIEASISSIVVASGPADPVEVLHGVGGIIDGGDKFKVALVAGRHDMCKGVEAVDGFLH